MTKAEQFFDAMAAVKREKAQLTDITGKVDLGMGKVLACLYTATDKLCAGDLVNMMGISNPRITVLLQKLEKNGYLVHEIDDEDRRKTFVSITEKGKAYYEAERSKAIHYIDYLLQEVGEDKMFDLIALLKEINTANEKYQKRE